MQEKSEGPSPKERGDEYRAHKLLNSENYFLSSEPKKVAAALHSAYKGLYPQWRTADEGTQDVKPLLRSAIDMRKKDSPQRSKWTNEQKTKFLEEIESYEPPRLWPNEMTKSDPNPRQSQLDAGLFFFLSDDPTTVAKAVQRLAWGLDYETFSKVLAYQAIENRTDDIPAKLAWQQEQIDEFLKEAKWLGHGGIYRDAVDELTQPQPQEKSFFDKIKVRLKRDEHLKPK